MPLQSASHRTDLAIAALAARQHTLVSVAQLAECGAGADAIRWRVERSRLHRQHRGVYSWGSAELTPRGRWLAAVLAMGPAAGLSFASGGMLLGQLTAAGGRIQVTVPGNGGRVRRKVFDIHRVAIEPWEIEPVDGIPCTTPARTLLDLSTGATTARIHDLITRTEELRLYDHTSVLAVLAAHPHHPGAARLRAALDTYVEPEALDDRFERLFLATATRAGLGDPAVQRPVGAYRLDFLWAELGLIVEVDGWATHGTRRAFEDDRARDAEHAAKGLQTIRFTALQITRRPDWVERMLRAAATQRRRAATRPPSNEA